MNYKLLLVGILLVGLLVAPSTAWYSTYSYRQLHNVTGTTDWTANQTNYQVPFYVSNASAVSAGSVAYTNGTTAANWSDIRFTSTSDTLYDYWIESTNATTAKVWVEIPSIYNSTTATQMYLYYNKSGDTSASNGTATFMLFDDFNNGTTFDTVKWLEKHSEGSTSGLSVASGNLTLSGWSIDFNGASEGAISTSTYSAPYEMVTRVQYIADFSATNNYMIPFGIQNHLSSQTFVGYAGGIKFMAADTATLGATIQEWDGAWHINSPVAGALSKNTWYQLSGRLLATGTNNLQMNITNETGSIIATNQASDTQYTSGYVMLMNNNDRRYTRNDGIFDWVFIKNYAATEPAHSTWYDVESPSFPPVSTFTSNVVSGTSPLSVQFNDTSTNTPTAWNWSFTNITPGNNTQIWFSTSQNPAQTFGVGNFSIVLNASNSAGYDISNQVTFINVSAATITPVASFTPSVISGTAPLSVTFTDTSSNTPTAWNWSFTNITPGNNTQIWFSTSQNPAQTFGVGNFSIVLNASNSAGYDISNATFINVSAAIPDALLSDFSNTINLTTVGSVNGSQTDYNLPVFVTTGNISASLNKLDQGMIVNDNFTQWLNYTFPIRRYSDMQQPIIGTNSTTSWANNQVNDQVFLIDGNMIRCYFEGVQYNGGLMYPQGIGVASVSVSDFLQYGNKAIWTVDASPIFTRSGTVRVGSVLKVTNVSSSTGVTYYLYVAEPGAHLLDIQLYTGETYNTFTKRASDIIAPADGEEFVQNPAVIRENATTWKMYYDVARASYTQWAVDVATSTDGITWTRVGQVFTTGGNGGWDNQKIEHIHAMKVNDTYVVTYEAADDGSYNHWATGIAYSTDFDGTFTKYAGNPILSGGRTADLTLLDYGHVATPTWFKINGIWYYSVCGNPHTTGWANDWGIELFPVSMPVISISGINDDFSDIRFSSDQTTALEYDRIYYESGEWAKFYVQRDTDTPAYTATNVAAAANGASATASSTYSGSAASNAIDGNYATEWRSNSEGSGAWLKVSLSGSKNLGKILLFGSSTSGSGIMSGRIVFSDGSTVRYGYVPAPGSASLYRIVEFPARDVTWFTVIADSPLLGTTSRILEVQAYEWSTGVYESNTTMYYGNASVSDASNSSILTSPPDVLNEPFFTNFDTAYSYDAVVTPVAAFSCTPLTGVISQSVTCTDASTNTPTTWAWYNGTTAIGTTSAITVTFGTGLHNINLNASNSAGYDWENKTGYINISSVSTPVASFTKNRVIDTIPQTYTFNDTSSNTPTNWAWYWFNNETVSSTSKNATAVLGVGTYDVRLYASNAAGGDWENKTGGVVVTSGTPITIRINATAVESPERHSMNSTFTSLRNGVGTVLYDDLEYKSTWITANATTSARYDLLARAARIYNTSSIPDNATITSVNETVYGNYYEDGLGISDIGVTGFTPATPGKIVITDFNTYGNTSYATALNRDASLVSDGWNTWVYNAAGIANISKTGNTNVMHRLKWDIDNSTTGLTWSAGAGSGMFFNTNNTAFIPYLTLTYTYGTDGINYNITPYPSSLYKLMPTDHIYNARVDSLPLLSNSASIISTAGNYCTDHAGYCVLWPEENYPINVVNSTLETQYLTYIENTDSDYIAYPIPPDAKYFWSDDAGEGNMFIVSWDNRIGYEFYNQQHALNGTWSAALALDQNYSAYNLTANAGIGAAGIPQIPGLITYEEVSSGAINHSGLASMYTSKLGTHTWPAIYDGYTGGTNVPMLGQRFRLNASFNETGYTPAAKVVLEGWKKYGFMLSDQNADTNAWTIRMTNDTRWEDVGINWTTFLGVHSSDFEAVNVSALMISADSGQTQQVAPTAHFQMAIVSTGGLPPGGSTPVPNYTSTNTTLYEGGTVYFTDTSTNTPTSWSWYTARTSDNLYSQTSTAQNPSFTYSNSGGYTVNLVATNAYGSALIIRPYYVTILTGPPTPDAPVANFTYTPTTITTADTVLFTDTSTNTPTSWHWEVSNGRYTLDYYTRNISQNFGTVGSYGVALTATNAYGPSFKGMTIPVYAPTPTPTPTVPPTTYGYGAYTGSDPIGGGSGYGNIKSTGNYTATSKAELLSALSGATSGQTVYVTPGTTIDLTGTLPVGIPAGVTLASNRGTGGSSGAIIKKLAHTSGYSGNSSTSAYSSSSWEEPMFWVMGDNVRITGLKLQGEGLLQDQGYETGEEAEGNYLVGIFSRSHSGLTVDNNEIYGWSWSGVQTAWVTNTIVKNNYIHSNQARGEGYGSSQYGGFVTYEANIYDYNRHDITGAGYSGEGYESRYNRLLGHGNAIGAANFDAHQDELGGSFAGANYTIHHNTVDGGVIAFAHARHKPTVGFTVNYNVINSDGSDTGTSGDVPIYQTFHTADGYTTLQNMFITNNQWKGTTYPSSSGITWVQVL